MTIEELLVANQKATLTVQKFYIERLLSALDDSNFSEEQKETIKSKSFGMKEVAKMIENSPRALFDVFDANEVYIGVSPVFKIGGIGFNYTVSNVIAGEEPTRKQADMAAVSQAFVILNNKL